MRKMTEKIISALIALTVLFALVSPAKAVVFHPDVRVLLSLGGPDELTVKAYGSYTVKEAPDFSVEKGEKYTIQRVGGQLKLSDGSDSVYLPSVTFINPDYQGKSAYLSLRHPKYGTCTYLGDMRFDLSDGIRAINTLPLELYVYGVVPHEMSNTFPLDALKAQAVCARGYAIACCSAYSQREYDILDTSQDQVYHGYASRYTRAIQAVDDTAGQVLSYEGDMIQSYYSASNGGQTELTGNVWSSDLPYYVQRDDEYDLLNPSSLEELSFIPERFTSETRPLMDSVVLELLQQGANSKAGESVVLMETVRVKPYAAKYDAPSRCYTRADVTMVVMGSAGIPGQLTVTVDLTALKKTDENPAGIFAIASTNLRMMGAERGVYTARSGEEYHGFYLTNRRYGHGVGLSQRGAQQRATMGQGYLDILDFYYAKTLLLTVASYSDAPQITSTRYIVNASGIYSVSPGTEASELMGKLSAQGARLFLVDAQGNKKSGEVCTGDLVRMAYSEDTVYLDLPVVIFGDTDGDGRLSRDDVSALIGHLTGDALLYGAYLQSADVDHDGRVDIMDALLLQKQLHRTYTIDQTGGLAQ